MAVETENIGVDAEADPWVINGPAEMVSVDLIRPHERNPRQGNVGEIIELIKKNGFFGHCIVQRSTGKILVGNHRYKAAVQVGMREVPVQWVDVTDEHAERILLSDNRSGDLASYDNDLLIEMLKSRADVPDLAGTGFDGDALDQLVSDREAALADLNSGGEKNSGGAPVIQYNIIFDDEGQQRRWFTFLNELRKAYSDNESIGGRIIEFLKAHPIDLEAD